MDERGRDLSRALGFPADFDIYADNLEWIAVMYDQLYGTPPELILDTGYGWGLSCAVWLTRWPACRVVCISPDVPGEYSTTADGLRGLPPDCVERFEFIKGRAEDAVTLMAGREVDMVMLDTEHAYPAQVHQMAATWSVLKPGGFFCGHDYDQPDVYQGTDEFLETVDQRAERIPSNDTHDFFALQKEYADD